MAKPRLIIITGPPGSGKTTLAKKLAAKMRYPLLCRDEFKEGYVQTHGASFAAAGPDVNTAVYHTFFAAIDFLLTEKISLMAEAAFQHKAWAPQLEALQEKARLSLIICQVDPHLARQRRQDRARHNPAWHKFHGDTDARHSRQKAHYQPPDLPIPTLHVTTTAGYDPHFKHIVRFLRETAQR